MQSAIPSQLGLTHRTGSLQESLVGKTLLVIGATAFVAACAHISLPLPFTPVPLTLQNFAVILVGHGARPCRRLLCDGPVPRRRCPRTSSLHSERRSRWHRSSARPQRRFSLLLPAGRCNRRLGRTLPAARYLTFPQPLSSPPPPRPCPSFFSALDGLPTTPTIAPRQHGRSRLLPSSPARSSRLPPPRASSALFKRWRQS